MIKINILKAGSLDSAIKEPLLRLRLLMCALAFFLLISQNLIFAEESGAPAFFFFKESVIMAGGNSKVSGREESSVTIETDGENWVSLPFMIDKSGFYKMTVVKGGHL